MELREQLRRAAALRESGRVLEAIEAYESVLRDHPDLPDSWFNLGWLRRQAGRHEAALVAYDEALRRGVRGPAEVHVNRAIILSDHLLQPEEAARALQAALALDPTFLPAWLNLGNLHEDLGERDKAAAAYRRALQLAPDHPLALARYASLHHAAHAADPVVGRLRAAIGRPGTPAAARADLGFVLAGLLDRAALYEEAFAAARAANEAAAESLPEAQRYNPAAAERFVDRLLARFEGSAAGAEASAPAHLFICGLFRSGSTLAERILAAHPAVTAGGELDLLPRLLRENPGVLERQARSAAQVAALGHAYHSAVARLFPGAGFVTDKRPDNFLWLGLIASMLPGARVVHTRRHPLDTCLSIYFLHLGPAMPYACSLRDIAHWYGLYRRVMAQASAQLGARCLDLDYEDVVRTPRSAVERLLAFCGLPWADECLQFHRRPGSVKTASVWQVREPLHDRSVGRWRHYERQLDGLREALARSGVATD